MLPTVDRYVLREWLTILALVIGATFGLLLLVDVSDSFPDLLEYGAQARQVLRYYAVKSPSLLAYVLPIAVLVSLLYALGQMHRNSEIVAMRSAGLSLARITRSVWVVVALISGGLFHLNSSVVPWSIEEARLMMTNLEFGWQVREGGTGDQVGVETSLTYENRRDRRLWHLSRYSRYFHEAHGIHVSVRDAAGREIRRVLAAKGVWDEFKRAWTFENGVEVLDPVSPDRVRPVPFDRLEFPDFQEDPEWMALLLRAPKNLSLFELGRIIDSPDTMTHRRRAAYAVRYHWLLAGTFGCLIAAGLAIPFAVSGIRVNPAVGVSKALGLFAGYWIMNEICRLLGEQEALVPWLAAWLPIAAMVAVAGWFMWRER